MLSHSQRESDLSLIFFKIRTSRTTPARRSWQRRARLALNQIAILTDAEKHEIMVAWSHPNCHRVNSPALEKLTGRPSLHDADIDARTLYRAAFDANGQQITRQSADAKKPGLARRFDYGPAANDAIFSPGPCKANHPGTACIAPGAAAPLPFLSMAARSVTAHHEPAWGDSDSLSCPNCGNPCYPPRPALPMPYLPRLPAPRLTPIFSFLPFKFNSNALRRATIDVQTFDYQRPYLLTPLDRFRLTQHHNPMAPTTPDDWP